MDAFADQFEKTIKRLFGEVPIPEEMSFELQYKKADTFRSHLFQIRVTYLFFSQEGAEKKTLTFNTAISEVALQSYPTKETLWDLTISDCLLKKAYMFYPWDPRYGWSMRDPQDQLCVSPLFDPPLLKTRNGLMIDPMPQLKCPFCQEEHNSTYPPVWGGGTLRWVHDHCLPPIPLTDARKLFVA